MSYLAASSDGPNNSNGSERSVLALQPETRPWGIRIGPFDALSTLCGLVDVLTTASPISEDTGNSGPLQALAIYFDVIFRTVSHNTF